VNSRDISAIQTLLPAIFKNFSRRK